MQVFHAYVWQVALILDKADLNDVGLWMGCKLAHNVFSPTIHIKKHSSSIYSSFYAPIQILSCDKLPF
jgi:hypothetical protein